MKTKLAAPARSWQSANLLRSQSSAESDRAHRWRRRTRRWRRRAAACCACHHHPRRGRARPARHARLPTTEIRRAARWPVQSGAITARPAFPRAFRGQGERGPSAAARRAPRRHATHSVARRTQSTYVYNCTRRALIWSCAHSARAPGCALRTRDAGRGEALFGQAYRTTAIFRACSSVAFPRQQRARPRLPRVENRRRLQPGRSRRTPADIRKELNSLLAQTAKRKP